MALFVYLFFDKYKKLNNYFEKGKTIYISNINALLLIINNIDNATFVC